MIEARIVDEFERAALAVYLFDRGPDHTTFYLPEGTGFVVKVVVREITP